MGQISLAYKIFKTPLTLQVAPYNIYLAFKLTEQMNFTEMPDRKKHEICSQKETTFSPRTVRDMNKSESPCIHLMAYLEFVNLLNIDS